MGTIRFKLFNRRVTLSTVDVYKPGDPAPKGYMEWHEWADVQYKAGLRQQKCDRCRKWLFPQQVDTHTCQPNLMDAGR